MQTVEKVNNSLRQWIRSVNTNFDVFSFPPPIYTDILAQHTREMAVCIRRSIVSQCLFFSRSSYTRFFFSSGFSGMGFFFFFVFASEECVCVCVCGRRAPLYTCLISNYRGELLRLEFLRGNCSVRLCSSGKSQWHVIVSVIQGEYKLELTIWEMKQK